VTPALVRRAIHETRLLPKLQQLPEARQPGDPREFRAFLDVNFHFKPTQGRQKSRLRAGGYFAGCTGSLVAVQPLSGSKPIHRRSIDRG
jgi:hypothetical protein